MLRIGVVGFGFMGRMHYANWSKCKNAEVVAICDADPNALKNKDESVGNIEGADDKIDFSGMELYNDVADMLDKANLDAVSITLPTFLHARFSIMALEAGAHVLCEKPMALDTEQCRPMIGASNRSGKVLQIGHCIRFWPEYARAKEIIDSGKYGSVIAATFTRFGSMPTWGADDWFANDERSGGVALDLHIHDSDFVQYIFGMPKGVQSFGNPVSGKGLKYIKTLYCFDDEKLVTAEGTWAMTPSFGFQMSFNIIMEKASIVYDCSREPSFRVCPAGGDAFTPEVAAGDGYSRQIEHFASLISGEKPAEVITMPQSLDSIRLVKAEIESIQKKRKVLFLRA